MSKIVLNHVDFAEVQIPNPGKTVLGFDLDGRLKKMEDSGEISPIGAEFIIDTTHAEFLVLLNNNRLYPGTRYRITDYQSYNFLHGKQYTVKQFFDIHIGEIEAIIVTATSNNTISTVSYSETYKTDMISYDPTATGLTVPGLAVVDNPGNFPGAPAAYFSNPIMEFDIDSQRAYIDLPVSIYHKSRIYMFMRYNGGATTYEQTWLELGITPEFSPSEDTSEYMQSDISVGSNSTTISLSNNNTRVYFDNINTDISGDPTLLMLFQYETSIQEIKGAIYHRKDTVANIDIGGVDWRHAKYRRYKYDLSEFLESDTIVYSGTAPELIIKCMSDHLIEAESNGTDYLDLYIFTRQQLDKETIYNIKIDDLDNTVFYTNSPNNRILVYNVNSSQMKNFTCARLTSSNITVTNELNLASNRFTLSVIDRVDRCNINTAISVTSSDLNLVRCILLERTLIKEAFSVNSNSITSCKFGKLLNCVIVKSEYNMINCILQNIVVTNMINNNITCYDNFGYVNQSENHNASITDLRFTDFRNNTINVSSMQTIASLSFNDNTINIYSFDNCEFNICNNNIINGSIGQFMNNTILQFIDNTTSGTVYITNNDLLAVQLCTLPTIFINNVGTTLSTCNINFDFTNNAIYGKLSELTISAVTKSITFTNDINNRTVSHGSLGSTIPKTLYLNSGDLILQYFDPYTGAPTSIIL